MTTITQDDVAAHAAVLAAMDAADLELRDFTDRLRGKQDTARVDGLRRALDTLGRARRQVEEQLR